MKKKLSIVLVVGFALTATTMMVPQVKGACLVEPTSLDFGAFCCDGGYNNLERTFTITNTGPNSLSGTVTESCEYYSIPDGGGSYTLAAGESRTVTVRFTPTFAGGLWEKIETGYGLCCDVFCYCTGISCCFVWPFSLDFGDVDVGSYQDEVFSISNNGPDAFSGNVTESCEHYSIPDGGGPYTLDPGQSRMVTVRFEPDALGTHTCAIETGSAFCSGDVSCTGVGTYVPDPDCEAANIDGINTVDSIDFAILASNWRLAGPNLPADLNTDGIVDINDLGMFAVYWLINCIEPWPECWSCPRQCYGDADCAAEGIQRFWVSVSDVAILQAAWLTSYPDALYNPCADFDRDGDVDVDDLTVQLEWYNQPETIGPPADCEPGGTWPPEP